MAETFSSCLHARVEALCELVGRLAEVQIRETGLKFAPAVHCRWLVACRWIAAVGSRRVRWEAVRGRRCHQSDSRIRVCVQAKITCTQHRRQRRWTPCTDHLHSISQTQYGVFFRDVAISMYDISRQQPFPGRERAAATQGDEHRYHHRWHSVQGWYRSRRRHARNRRPDRRRQELRKGASPHHRPSPASRASHQIHYISESIRCCGAGTAADTEFVTAMISSNIELHALSTGRKPRVVTAMTMLKQHLYKCVLTSCRLQMLSRIPYT